VIDRRERARRRRRKLLVRWGVRVLAAAAIFAAGVALGEALHDNPRPGGTQTIVSTFSP
jgi:hypothetical protein